MSRKRRYCLLALGSRGDVQPFVALGLGLKARGYEVVIAAAEDYGALVTEQGLNFAPLVGRIADRMDRTAVADSLDGGILGSLRLALRLRADATPLMDCLFTDTLTAARSCDTLVVSTLGQYVGHSVAEACGGLPVVAAHFHPYSPSCHYADMFFPALRLGGLYNRLTHRMGKGMLWQLLRPALNGARRRVLGLPPLGIGELERFLQKDNRAGLHLHAYSPALAPAPPDWDTHRQIVTGYWHTPRVSGWRPPADLAAFLEAGSPPVYMGFGSILAGRDPDGMTRLLGDALARAGVRGVLYRGWGDLGNIALPPTVFATESVPHDYLFPRCAVIVHHGGAGTTAAALRARTPAVVVPVFGDQQFWARRLYETGVSPAPLPRRHLTATSLAEAITAALTSPTYRERTQVLGSAIQAEDGVERAITILGY
jgi:sterol 3beta-glucosyltransferase